MFSSQPRVFAAAMATGAFFAISSGALATTYNIDVDGCSGSGCGLANYGTIDVTDVGGTGTNLHFVVNLLNTVFAHDSNASTHPTFVFNLNYTGAAPTVSIDPSSNSLPLDVTPPGTSGWQFNSVGLGSYTTAALGTFNFDIECTSGEAGNTCGHKLIFDLNGTGLSLFSNLVGTKNVFFSLDISNSTATGALTGNVGATACLTCAPPPPGETPIPGALPLFASGMGVLGFLGWRRKRRLVRQAA